MYDRDLQRMRRLVNRRHDITCKIHGLECQKEKISYEISKIRDDYDKKRACLNLIDEMVKNGEADDVVTAYFLMKYNALCKERKIMNVIPENAISKAVTEHGYVTVPCKIDGNGWRKFARKQG